MTIEQRLDELEARVRALEAANQADEDRRAKARKIMQEELGDGHLPEPPLSPRT